MEGSRSNATRATKGASSSALVPPLAAFGRHPLPCAELRVQRKIAPKLPAILPIPILRARQSGQQLARKKRRSLPSLRYLVCSSVSCRKKPASLRALPRSWPSESRGQSSRPVPVRARARRECRRVCARTRRPPQIDRPRGPARSPRAYGSQARWHRSGIICVRVPRSNLSSRQRSTGFSLWISIVQLQWKPSG